jgi:hypothetical protein
MEIVLQEAHCLTTKKYNRRLVAGQRFIQKLMKTKGRFCKSLFHGRMIFM